jgi:hypothetical protein
MTTGQPKEIWEEEGEVLAESLAGALNAAEIPCEYFLYQPPNLLLLSDSGLQASYGANTFGQPSASQPPTMSVIAYSSSIATRCHANPRQVPRPCRPRRKV